MTISEAHNHLAGLIGHLTFDYNGYSCGIDPLATDEFEMWYGNKEMTATSVNEVMTENFFDEKCLKDIWSDITELDY